MSRYYSARSNNKGNSAVNKVYLNVYDLMDNEYLYAIGFGAYHSGITLFNFFSFSYKLLFFYYLLMMQVSK